jgi:S-(hydroxymethyl)mycothiol dehydrogenase
MKAAICYQFGQPLRVEDIEIEAPAAGEVKVQIAATAICHSDLHYIRGDWNAQVPVVVGHETAGIVTEVGAGVTRVRPGQRVAISLIRVCGDCFYCAMGAPQRCEGKFALQTETRLHTHDGTAIQQGVRVGGFADYAIVHQSQVVALPDDIPFACAALLTCGVVTGIGAVVHTAQVQPGSNVVVIGAGGVGLNVVQGAYIAGASQIIAVDPIEMKREAARKFGATHTLPVDDRTISAVLDLTGGRGADYAFVTVGNAAAVTQGFSLLRPKGTLVIVGQPPISAMVSLPVREISITEKRILGCLMGSTALQRDIPWLVSLYQQGRLKLDELISAYYPLEAINEAIAATEQGQALRSMIVWPV